MGRGSLAYRVCSKKIVFCIFLILIVVSSTVLVQPSQAAELQRIRVDARRNRLPGEIGIFYDSGDAVLSQISTDLVSALRIANVSSSLFEVSSFAQLELLLSRSGVWVAVYVFNSGLGNVSLGREVVDWEDFAGFLLRHDRVHHILGIGNARRLVDLIGLVHENIHVADTDLVDAKLVFLFSFWAVADVLESMPSYLHKEAELDIRRVGLQFFADNFNDLFERTVKPKAPLGEEDVVRKTREFEEIRKRFPTSSHELPLIPPDGLTPDEMVKNGTSNEQEVSSDESSLPPPRLYLTRMPGTSTVVNEAGVRQSLSGVNAGGGSDGGSASESLYEVLGLPTKSGLDGPVGTILDYVLKVLIEVGGYTSAALGESTVQKIVDAVKAIKTLIGVVKDAQGGSPLKSLFDILKLEFPALAGYEKYFDLFVEGLEVFRERNDMGRVLDFVLQALGVVFSDVAPEIANLVQNVLNVLSQSVDVGADLYNRIRDSDSVFNAILSWFNEKLMDKVVAKFLNETASALGWNVAEKWSQILDGAEKIVGTVNAAIDFLINGNSTRLVKLIDEAVFEAFQLDSIIGEDNVERIKTVIKLVASVLGYSEPTKDVLKGLLGKSLNPFRLDIVRLAYGKLGNKYLYDGGHTNMLYGCGASDYAGIYPNDLGMDEGKSWYNYTQDGKTYGYWKFEITKEIYLAHPDDWKNATQPKGVLVEENGRYFEQSTGWSVREGRQIKTADLVLDNGRWKRRGEGGQRGIFLDCAGLVYYVYREAGLSFGSWTFGNPSVSDPWGLGHLLGTGGLGESLPGPENLQPGDLVGQFDPKGAWVHVGIYVGQDSDDPSRVAVIHASDPQWGVVKISYPNLQSLTTFEDSSSVPPAIKWDGFFRLHILDPPKQQQSTLSKHSAAVYGSASISQDFDQIIQSVSEALAIQIMSDISNAVKEGQSDVASFKSQILTHIDEALTSEGIAPEEILDSRKQFLADAITLVAGLMNQNFEKSALPTLGAVFNKQLSNLDVPDLPFLDDLTQTLGKTMNVILGTVAMIKEDTGMKQALTGVVEQFGTQYGQPIDVLENLAELSLSRMGLTDSEIISIRNKIETVATIGQTVFQLWKSYKENSVQGLMQTLLMGAGYSTIHYFANQFDLADQFNLTLYTSILKAVFPRVMGVQPPTSQQIADIVGTALDEIPDSEWHAEWPAKGDVVDTVRTITTLAISAEDIFSDGYRWILDKTLEWLSGKTQELADSLTAKLNEILSQSSFFHVDGEFELPLGSFTSFGMKYDLALDAGVNIRTDELFKLVEEVVFQGYDIGMGTLEDTFKTLMTFIEITPVFKASLDITGFGSEDSRFMNMLLESLGLELTFEGGAHFVAELFSFKAGAFEPSGFLKVVEWGLWFKIEVSRDFTLLDFLTGGAGGGALETLADYIGLDSITITVWFGLTLEVIKRAASATGPEQGTFTLMIEIGVALSLGIDILIASIDIYGSIKVVFTFAQDLLNTATPLRILMDIVAEVKVTLGFLFWDWDINWGPSKLYSHDFSGKPEDQDPNKRADPLGVDSDGDGLSDEYENRTAGLRFDLSDTDGDSLSDKEETQTTKTDPTKSDTDGDGLNDYDEYYQYKTNPKLADTDYDGVNDYEEVVIYGTNPKLMDTDADGLDDYYEINHVWDISNVTTSVKEVHIGGKVYNDHTDPLNPDTDNDGLLDGEEGKFGIYYGDKELYNQSLADEGKISQARYFNYGYTHPLDNDTDDDSYLQLWDGSSALVSGQKRYLRSMTDGEEVKGIWVTFYNSEEDEWERRLVRTNPCNPDTDGDTGIPGDWNPAQLTVDRFLMSDGYELSLNPPTDPTNGDSDHDGLLDGLEGVINPYPNSYHTNWNSPDTDGDGLGDLQEIKLGTDPRNPDTDHDSVLDGDEYHRFHTDPRLPDTDYDGLTDGEEVYFWHTNPHIRDSDGDRISDGQEVLKYDTDPLDEDTDNDEINDYDEIFNYRTDPFNPDTDGDGLRDGPEVFKRHTDPLNWDTDGDSIKYLNEYGNMTWPMSDGDEVNIYHTDPARTDTDNDGLSDSLELYLASGRIPHNVLEPIPLDATNNDTDGDGLLDGVELRMGNTTSIIYPYIAFMPYSFYGTSPVKSDSDNDGLTDFEEVNGTLPSPRSFQPGSTELGHAKFNYTGSRADMPDTDADGLLDGEEVFIYGTDPVRNDTDGDGLMDCYETLTGDSGRKARRSEIYYARLGVGGAEILGAPNASFSFVPLRQRAGQRIVFDASTSYDEDGTISSYFWNFSDGATSTTTIPITSYTYSSYGTYKVSLTVTDNDGKKTITEGTVVVRLGTDALNPDTDGDLLPDGYEVDPDRIAYVSSKYGFTLDSLQSDVNNNGILDGYEIDSDSDGLKDGEEIFIFETQRTWRKGSFMAGGFLNPDSDGDGLSDGVEVHDFQTDPLKSDTDKDGYSDGAEVAAGTDPLKPTSSTEYTDALNNLRKGTSIRILYPTNSTISDRIVDVRVVNFTSIESMWYRYDSGVGWSANRTLSYNHAELQWTDTDIVWNEGSYHIQIFGKTPEGYELWDEQWFSIKTPKEEIPFVAGWQIKIISPTPSTIYDSRVDLYVLNSTDVVNVWFRFDIGSGWMGNYTLEYNSVAKQWENTTTVWPVDSYHLQVFAFTLEDKVIWDEQWFTVKTGWIEIMSPTNTTVLDTGVDVIVANSSSVEDVWIRYHNGQNWSDNRTMVYDSVASKWKHTEIVWPEATYHIQAFASTPDGRVLTDEEWFTVRIEKTPALYIVLGVVISGLAATLLTYGGLRSRRLKGPKSREESKTGNEGERE